MVVAALIVSVVAAAIALSAAFYARVQAVETRKLRKIESERRHHERTPVLAPEIESVNGGGWHRLWLRLDSADPLTSVRVEVMDEPRIHFPSSQDGVEPGGHTPAVATWKQLTPGERPCWRIELPEKERPHKLRLRVTAAGADGEAWTLSLPVDVPGDPQAFVRWA